MHTPLGVIVFLAISACLCSCASYPAQMIAHWETREDLRQQPSQRVEGQYANDASDGRARLWALLTYGQSESNDVVMLRVTDARRIEATLRRDGRPVATEQFKFRTYPRHLSLSSQNHFGGAFPLLWLWNCEDLSLGTPADGSLSVYREWASTRFAGPLPLFAAGGGPGLVYHFARIDQDDASGTVEELP